MKTKKGTKSVLITGGAGFIGSHLTEEYLKCGYKVIVLDNLSTGNLKNLSGVMGHKSFRFIEGTVYHNRVVGRLVEQADIIFHLAAAVGVKLIVEKPVHTIETNVHGTEVVLQHAAKKKKKVVIASTSEVYGKSDKAPFHENQDLLLGPTVKMRWSYACSKALDEFLALAYWREKNVPVIIVRLFNTVGPRQTGQYGMVIPGFVDQALSGKPITVYGDGSQTRTFTWVGDVVSALVALTGHPKAVGEVFNVGGTEEISILQLAKKVKEISGSSSEIIHVPYEKAYQENFEDIPRRVPDITKIQKLIGYQPSIKLEEILRRIIESRKEKCL